MIRSFLIVAYSASLLPILLALAGRRLMNAGLPSWLFLGVIAALALIGLAAAIYGTRRARSLDISTLMIRAFFLPAVLLCVGELGLLALLIMLHNARWG